MQPEGLLCRQKYLSEIRFPEEVNAAENEFGCDIQFAKRQLEIMYLADALIRSASAIGLQLLSPIYIPGQIITPYYQQTAAIMCKPFNFSQAEFYVSNNFIGRLATHAPKEIEIAEGL